ncbi:MAG: PAS domain S-box protein, partial [Candidatus Hodarchaeales archaeon]
MKRTKQSEEKYRVMFENSPISIWEEDFSAVKRFFDSLRSDGITNIREYLNNHPEQVSKCAALVKIIDVNQATLQLYGMKDQEDLISNLTFVFTQESLPAFRGELTALAEGHTTFECEAITQSLDGRRIPIELKLNVLPGYEETLAKVIVSIIDLSKHKAMEEALLRSEVNFTKAFHSNPNLMLITKPLLDGLIIDINQTAVQALGFDYEEMIGKTTIELNLWARPERRDELLRILAKQGSFHNEEIQVRTKSGEIIIGLFSAETIELNNQPHLIAIASDITERKKAERILEKQKNELSEFAHIMAHDLKNSLLSIEGYCDLL